jgi:hypothetical protein
MTATRFKVGDRISARIYVHGVASGTLGTIQRVFASVDDLYDVQFDGQPHLYAVRGTDLQRAAEAPRRVPEPSSLGTAS